MGAPSRIDNTNASPRSFSWRVGRRPSRRSRTYRLHLAEMERKEEAGAGGIRDSRLGRKGCALGKGKEKGKDKIQSERNSLREATNNGDPLIKMDEKNTMKSRENKGNRCFES